jgi:hypothetical protein
VEYTVQTGSAAMICIPSFIWVGSGIQKIIEGYTDTQIAWRSDKPTLISSKYGKQANSKCLHLP